MTQYVALFLDLDNLIIAARQARIKFDINIILDYLKQATEGRIVLRRAYGDWRQNSKVPENLAVAGFELQSTVRLNDFSKNLADMQMVVDAMETLIDGHDFATYVLMTGDRDFTPLVQTLRKRGKLVIGMGFRHTASRSLVRLCDEYVYCDELLQGRSPAEKGRKTPATATNGETPLSIRYSRALKKSGLRVVPAEKRMVVLRELTDYLHGRDDVVWGEIIRYIYQRYRQNTQRRLSKNSINDVLIVAKRAQVIQVDRGKTLSSAPVQLAPVSGKPFQEAVMRCDALYLQQIAELDEPFDVEQAAVSLYDSPGHARYLKVIHNRYNS
jgi:uncharacterized LabA/DUF88 family protein